MRSPLALALSLPVAFIVVACAKGASNAGSVSAVVPDGQSSLNSGESATSAGLAPSASASGALAPAKVPTCPCTAPGANTVVKDKEADGALIVAVTARDPANVREIRARARRLADLAKTAAPDADADGAEDACPIVVVGTALEVQDIDNGTEVVLKPSDPKRIAWLRHEARQRLSALTDSPPGGANGAASASAPTGKAKSDRK